MGKTKQAKVSKNQTIHFQDFARDVYNLGSLECISNHTRKAVVTHCATARPTVHRSLNRPTPPFVQFQEYRQPEYLS